MLRLSPFATIAMLGICISLLLLPARCKPRAEETLFPNKPLEWQRLDIGQHKLYGLSGLKPSSMYEVKVSYPGTVPVSLHLEFVSPGDEPSTRQGRRLLDTEKLIFETPADSISFCSTSLVRVTATWRGNSWQKARKEDPLLFNIVVAPMLFGVPTEVLPHAAIGLSLVGCVIWGTFRRHPIWPASVLLESFEGKDR
mmetsp:Transcript_30510/g.73299  ORF Transcript_30510/g.73299 Transcript_30510/m.73299 type:complete len:197 (+) Transcript_30510:114-704(+)